MTIGFSYLKLQGGSSITSMIFFPIKTKLSLLLLHLHFNHNAFKKELKGEFF